MRKEKIIEADVLCIGGGIAGMMAAINASEHGAKVVLVEKANTLRSGAGGVGCDHFNCYIPEVHGSDMTAVINEKRRGQFAVNMRDPEVTRVWFERSFDIVKLWDKWGIPMKYKGRYEFAGHSFPGSHFQSGLKYAGQMQKPVLTRQALKRGVKIVNRVMVLDLLADGTTAAGATGVDTREDCWYEFRAKSAVLTTGTVRRLYPSPTPGWMFNLRRPGTLTGDGRAMAFRAGAELAGMEVPEVHASPKYMCRSGQGTWIGVIRDGQDKAIGPFVTKPDRETGDMIAEVRPTLFSDYAASGKGPVYMDCRGISDEDLQYFLYWMAHEGNTAMLNHMAEEGIDLRKNPIEFMTSDTECAGVIRCNARTETSLKGLYAAGDEWGRGVSQAAIFGWVAGENAAEYAGKSPLSDTDKLNNEIEEKKTLLAEIGGRGAGPGWKEVNIALQQIMQDYAGPVRSATMLEAGYNHLLRLKKKALNEMVACNSHERVCALETLNLLDIGELVFIAATERKETRGLHVRADYPFTNPLLDKALIIKREKGKAVTEWR